MLCPPYDIGLRSRRYDSIETHATMVVLGDLIEIKLDQVDTCSPLAIQEFRQVPYSGSEGI